MQSTFAVSRPAELIDLEVHDASALTTCRSCFFIVQKKGLPQKCGKKTDFHTRMPLVIHTLTQLSALTDPDQRRAVLQHELPQWVCSEKSHKLDRPNALEKAVSWVEDRLNGGVGGRARQIQSRRRSRKTQHRRAVAVSASDEASGRGSRVVTPESSSTLMMQTPVMPSSSSSLMPVDYLSTPSGDAGSSSASPITLQTIHSTASYGAASTSTNTAASTLASPDFCPMTPQCINSVAASTPLSWGLCPITPKSIDGAASYGADPAPMFSNFFPSTPQSVVGAASYGLTLNEASGFSPSTLPPLRFNDLNDMATINNLQVPDQLSAGVAMPTTHTVVAELGPDCANFTDPDDSQARSTPVVPDPVEAMSLADFDNWLNEFFDPQFNQSLPPAPHGDALPTTTLPSMDTLPGFAPPNLIAAHEGPAISDPVEAMTPAAFAKWLDEFCLPHLDQRLPPNVAVEGGASQTGESATLPTMGLPPSVGLVELGLNSLFDIPVGSPSMVDNGPDTGMSEPQFGQELLSIPAPDEEAGQAGERDILHHTTPLPFSDACVGFAPFNDSPPPPPPPLPPMADECSTTNIPDAHQPDQFDFSCLCGNRTCPFDCDWSWA